MFGGRSPREHARTPKGRREVLDLVRQYQENDRRMALEPPTLVDAASGDDSRVDIPCSR